MLEGIPSPVTERQSDFLRRIARSFRHLIHLIDAVLTQTKAESGRIAYRLADVTVTQVLDDVEPLTALQRAKKRLAYDCSGCDRTMVLHADREKVVQILLNLISNAVKFTRARVASHPRHAPERSAVLCRCGTQKSACRRSSCGWSSSPTRSSAAR